MLVGRGAGALRSALDERPHSSYLRRGARAIRKTGPVPSRSADLAGPTYLSSLTPSVDNSVSH